MSEDVIQIDIESELQKVIGRLHDLPDQIAAPKLLKNALNSTARKVRKQMVRDVQGEYAIKKRKVLRDKSEGAPQVLTASTSNLSAAIRSRGPMQDIMTFMTRPNTATGAAAARVLSSGSLRPLEIHGLKAFVTTFSNGHVAIVQRAPPQRYSDAKSRSSRVKRYGAKADMTKIRKLLSPSVPHMLDNETVRGQAEELTYEILQAEIQKRIDQIHLN